MPTIRHGRPAEHVVADDPLGRSSGGPPRWHGGRSRWSAPCAVPSRHRENHEAVDDHGCVLGGQGLIKPEEGGGEEVHVVDYSQHVLAEQPGFVTLSPWTLSLRVRPMAVWSITGESWRTTSKRRGGGWRFRRRRWLTRRALTAPIFPALSGASGTRRWTFSCGSPRRSTPRPPPC